jgi:Domain of unknown function (DUF4395)
MHFFLGFGEQVDGYPVRVLNERTVQAGAGILFFFAMVTFMTAWLKGNFQPTRVFVVAFLIDFAIRLFINPRYAPSLILGQWAVRGQQPEWTGAPQKRFAWAIGFVLALVMFYMVVINSVIGPINLVICATCLVLMFFETAFGICIGCKLYNLFHKEAAQLCPGGICEVGEAAPVPGAGDGWAKGVILVGFFALVGSAAGWITARHPASEIAPAPTSATPSNTVDPAEAARCKVPDFAKAMGHEEKWKLHNHCQ